MTGYVGVVAAQHAAGTAFNTYTTAKSVINPQALWPIAGNQLSLGKMLRVSVDMAISWLAAQPTFTFQIMMGTPNIIAWSSGAITTSTAGGTSLPAHLEVYLRLDSEGITTAAKFLAVGILTGPMWVIGAVGAGAYGSSMTVPITAPAVGTGFDSTIANILDFWCGISVSNGSNGIQVFNYMVEDLGNVPL